MDLDHFTTMTKVTNKDILYIVAVVSNPARYQRRYKLFEEFCERMSSEPQVKLFTVELQNGDRPFETGALLKLRTNDEIWYKENLINIVIQTQLPKDWKYVAWIDADVEFTNRQWVSETIHQLQTYKVLQLFSHAIDMGQNMETLHVHTGVAYNYVNRNPIKSDLYSTEYHPGYAYAMRRETYDAIGGLLDFPILGSSDRHMALSFIGMVDKSLNHRLHENYKMLCRIFQEKCDRYVKKSFGYVNGTILHHFHGCKSQRFYSSRWGILVDHQFDPLRDITKNAQGLWVLDETKIKLRDEIIRYFRSINEDSTTLNIDYKYTKKKLLNKNLKKLIKKFFFLS
jgi:hypothetical protein